MKIQKYIDIWLVRKRTTRPIELVQGDTGIQLVFEFQDFEIPTDTVATLFVCKPSGKFVYQEEGIAVAENVVTVDLENQAITEYGRVPYQLTLKKGEDEITTFAGLMLVQSSLKDAGAVESKTVLRAFDEAVLDHVAELQAKAEQIVQACIATIPEDYTVMTAKVNQLANAIKGYMSGNIVKAADVSPVEHMMDVNAHGKNLFDVSKLSNISGKLTNNNDGTLTIDANMYAVPTGKKMYELCPSLKAGNVCTLSFLSTSGNTKYICLNGANMMLYNNTYTFTDEMLNSELYLYGFRDTDEGYGSACTISNIQIEKGTTATEYTPYIDPTTANVRRCGKNIFSVAGKTQTINGVTFTVNNDGTVIANGTATKATFMGLGSLLLKSGEKYRLSGSPAGSGFDTYLLYIHNNTTGADTYDLGEGKVFTGKEGDLGLTIAVYAGNTVNNLIFRPMVVYGEESVPFELYNGTKYIPASDGTVTGMTSLSPNMTILTDTEGMIIECEYNKDTNKVIQKICDALGIDI